jgi:putative spermidine/putrescine transport system substrate-binding protein
MSKRRIIEITKDDGRTGVTRRRFVAGTSAAAAASAVSWPLILTPGKAKASEQIVIPSWGGAYAETLNEAFYKPFTQKTGIPIIVGPQPDLAKIQAMVRTGNVEYDLVDLITGWVIQGENEGLWEPINTNIVNRDGVMKVACRERTQAYYVAAGGLTYHEGKFGKPEQHPKSWAEFWDVQKFPGRRVLRADRAAEMLECALMADGVHPRQMYPLDVERAFKSLDKIKPHITHWPTATVQTIQLVEKGEADFSYSYNSRVFASRKAGNPVEFVFNNMYIHVGYTAVVSKSRNKEAAMKLIAYLLDPQAQARWANLYGLIGTHQDSGKYIAADAKARMNYADHPNSVIENIDWWGPRNAELMKRYKEWLLT